MRRAHLITGKPSPLYVASAGVGQNSTSGIVTLNIPSHSVNDFALLFRVGYGPTTSTDFATPTGYNLIATTTTTTLGGGMKVSKFWKVLGSETTVSLSATAATDGGSGAVIIVIYRNISAYSAIDGSTANTTNSTTYSYPALSSLDTTKAVVSVAIGNTTSIPGPGSTSLRVNRVTGYATNNSRNFPWSVGDILSPTTASIAETQSVGATINGQVTENYELTKA